MSPSPRDPDPLLQHGAYLRRLARGLLGDPGTAEDVVQEAWIATLRSGVPAEAPVRGFLAGWVRNRASQARREEGRRRRRERVAARPERVAAEVEAGERLAVLRFVLRVVDELEEPYRTAVSLRYLEGLPPRAIAARTGVPVNTARSHVQRGLERVRGRLERECPGGRDVLLGALVPLAGKSFVGAVGAAHGVGVLAMKSSLAIVGGVVLALVGAWFGWLAWDATQLDGLPPLPVRVAQSDAGGPAARGAGGVDGAQLEGPQRTEVVPSAAGEWVVRGRVESRSMLAPDVEGAAVAGMAVALRRVLGDDVEAGRLEREARVTSDADGRFDWALDAPDGDCVLDARAIDAHGNEVGRGLVRVPAGEAAPLLVVVLPTSTIPLEGIVRGPEGQPIAGARVASSTTAVTSDDEGRYSLAFSAVSGPARVTCDAVGYAPVRITVEPRPGAASVRADFDLRAELALHGRVTDADGRPVEGAEVRTFYGEDLARSAADGTYRLRGLDPGRPRHMVRATKAGFVMAQVDVTTDGAREREVDLVLERGVEVRGRVLDAGRAPVADAVLYIGFSPFAWDRLDAKSDADGRFVFSAVPRGSKTLVTQADGMAPDSRTLEVPADGAVLHGLEVVLDAGVTLAGHVVDAQGAPVAGAGIHPRLDGEYVADGVQADEDGAFRLEHLPRGDVALEVYASGFVRTEVPVPAADTSDLRIRLEASGALAGTVVEAATGAPLSSFRIRFATPQLEPGERSAGGYSATWVREGVQFESARGEWSTGDEELQPGTVLGIEASAPGYAPRVVPRVVVTRDPRPADLVIALSAGAVVRGTVTAADTGAPLAGVQVKRVTREDPLLEYDSDDVHGRLQGRTDDDGRYSLGDVPEGEMFLAFEHPDFGRHVVGPLVVEAGAGIVERDVALTMAATLSGVVLDARRAPVPGVLVTLRQVDVPVASFAGDAQATADAAGRFTFEHLVDGRYAVSREERMGFGPPVRWFTRFVTIRGGAPVQVELAPPGGATLSGTIDLAATVAEMRISVMRTHDADGAQVVPSEEEWFAAPVRDGRFEVEGLEAGRYLLMASHCDEDTRACFRVEDEVEVGAQGRTEVALAGTVVEAAR